MRKMINYLINSVKKRILDWRIRSCLNKGQSFSEKDALSIFTNQLVDKIEGLKLLKLLSSDDKMKISRNIKTPSFILDEMSNDIDWQVRAEIVLNPNLSVNTLIKMSDNADEEEYILNLISKKSKIFSTFAESPYKTMMMITQSSMLELNWYSFRYYIQLTNDTTYLKDLYFLCLSTMGKSSISIQKNIDFVMILIALNHNIPLEVGESMYKNRIAIRTLMRNRSFKKTSCYQLAMLLNLLQ